MHDKAINIGKNPKYDGYKRDLPSIVYTFFDKKKPPAVVLKMRICQSSN